MSFILFVFVFIGIFVATHFYRKHVLAQRKLEMQAAAQSLGYACEDNLTHLLMQFKHFKLLQNGRSQEFLNVMGGQNNGFDVRIGDYRYVTGSGRSRRSHHVSLVILQKQGAALPHFFVRKEMAVFDFLGKVFGGQDINFVDDPVFSNAFVLQGLVERDVRVLFSPQVRQQFSMFASQSITIEGHNDMLLFHKNVAVPGNGLATLECDAMDLFTLLSNQAEQAGFVRG